MAEDERIEQEEKSAGTIPRRSVLAAASGAVLAAVAGSSRGLGVTRAAFLSLPTFPGYRDAFDLHRRAAIEHAALLLCDGESEPALRSPFG